MSQYIVTISSKNFLKYTGKFIESVRKAGWGKHIIVFTPDEITLEGGVVIRIEQTISSELFNDARWLKVELLNQFKDGDKIVYMDSDILVKKGFDKVFDYEFASGWTEYDNVGDIEKIEEYRGYKGLKGRFSDGIIVLEVNRETRQFFDIYKLACYPSIRMGRGTICAFNIAIQIMKPDIQKLPKKYHYYTLDGLDNIPKDVCIIHYGGVKGKEYWEKAI